MNTKLYKMMQQIVAPIKERIMMAIARCVIASIDDTGGLQRVRLTAFADETLTDVERVQQYGMTSNPPVGSEGVVIFPFGSRDHGVLIAVEERGTRVMNLLPGEVAFYTDEGDSLIFKRGHIMQINTHTLEINAQTITTNGTTLTLNASASATINTPATTLTGGLAAGTGGSGGDATIYGDVISTSVGTSLQELKTTYNSHTHNENGTGGGVTNAPNQTV